MEYPKIELPGEVHMVDASRIVTDKLDSIYPLNMFMLGMASKYLPIEEEHLLASIKEISNFEVNKKAFELGKE
jgi:Pyruvate/2-oxoacid:ferredoxin oxidoreductase gamma subunit